MKKHGYSRKGQRHPLYQCWSDMKARCYNRNLKAFPSYGGRGIKVSQEWLDFQNFVRDMEPSWKPGLTIERKYNDGDYSKENCRWATRKEQARNRRTNRVVEIFGTRLPLLDWCKSFEISVYTVYDRLKRGWSVELAITTAPTR